MRKTVRDLMERQEYKSGLFWADKLVCLSSGEVEDVLMQAKCLFHLKEYHRAIHCIRSRDLHLMSLPCRHLIAKSHFIAKEWKEASEVIVALEEDLHNRTDTSSANTSKVSMTTFTPSSKDRDVSEDLKWRSSISLLKGQIFEALDNRSIAAECFKQALKFDIHNFEAFLSLTQHQMLTRPEEEDLLKLIDPQDDLTRLVYSSLLKKYSSPADEMTIVSDDRLQQNVDLMTGRAESCYYQCDYYQCIKLTTQVLNRDVFHTECLPIHISCLMELKKTNQLFDLAHKLVDLYPESAVSWYAVGCYYLMINKTDSARRYLNKATTLDPVFGPAWLLYGHSFAVESEHDQAMAAYFKASHLMRGCHLPLLYIGLEYGQTENTKLAEKFFNQALLIAPSDPFVLHELGVVCFQNQEYESAEEYFKKALKVIHHKKEITRLPEKWEPLLNNLGHTLRKMRKYDEALDFHCQAMILSPQNPTTYTAIGFVYSLMFKWDEAVEYFHKAQGLKREDPFSSQLLPQAIEHLISAMSPIPEVKTPFHASGPSKGATGQTTAAEVDMDISGE